MRSQAFEEFSGYRWRGRAKEDDEIRHRRLLSLYATEAERKAETAGILNRSKSTVKSHLTVVFRKLGTTTRLGFICIFTERHIRIS